MEHERKDLGNPALCILGEGACGGRRVAQAEVEQGWNEVSEQQKGMGFRTGQPLRQEGRRDQWMWTRAVCRLSAEKLRELSRSIAAILLFPVISGACPAPLQTTRTAGLALTSAHSPCGHTFTHPHRLSLTTCVHIHTRTLPHTDSHSHTRAALHSCFNSLRHPAWSC